MLVIATKPGFFGKLRAADDKFEVPDGTKASWFVAADKVKPKAQKAAEQKAEGSDNVADLT